MPPETPDQEAHPIPTIDDLQSIEVAILEIRSRLRVFARPGSTGKTRACTQAFHNMDHALAWIARAKTQE